MSWAKVLKLRIAGWYLYDFANSIAAIIGGIYFSKWFIENLGASSILFNTLFLISAIGILLTGKVIGNRIDKDGIKKWLNLSTIVSALGLLSLYLISQSSLSNEWIIYLTFPAFLLFLLSYQVSRICHNTFFKKVIPSEKQSKTTGYGALANWTGSLFGILITLPIVSIYDGAQARELTFLLATIVFSLLCPIAIFMMFKGLKQTEVVTDDIIHISSTFRIGDLLPTFSLIILVYFLLFDIMSTVQRNLPPFLTEVYKMTDQIQSFGFLAILLSAMSGGLFASTFIREINTKRWLFNATGILIVALVLFANSISKKDAGAKFGQLAAVERASGLFGPLFWIIPFSVFKSDVISNRVAMLFLAFLAVIALLAIWFNEKRDK